MTVTLRQMTPEEFRAWLPAQNAAYAADKVRAGNWAAATALAAAERQMAELLPQGVQTPGHEIRTILADGRPVGVLWVNVPAAGAEASAFVYNIEVETEHQGKGYGTAALGLVERELAGRGVRQLRLHVFGFNDGARRLYARLGFEVTNVSMTKTLG